MHRRSDLNDSAEKLSKSLINSYYSACPPKIIKPGRSAPFFTSDLKTARRETRAAFNHAKDGDPVKVAIRSKAQSNYNKLLKKHKRTKFQQFCNSVETISGASRLFKSLSSDPACSIGTLKVPSGEFTDSPEATLHHLLDVHFPGRVTSIEQQDPELPKFLMTSENSLAIANAIVSKEKTKWAVMSFSPLISASDDGIFPC